MTETIVILFLLVYIAVREYFSSLERKKLIDAYLAKNLTELKQAEQIDQSSVRRAVNEVPPDFIPLEEVSDEQFDEAIDKELGRESLSSKAKETLMKTIRRNNG